MTTSPSLPSCKRCGYKPSGKSRTDPQNRYYWGCVVQTISDELGYTKEEVHEIVKRLFFSDVKEAIGKDGSRVLLSYSKSTTLSDTKEWEEKMSEIREWASMKLGIYIMSPDEAPIY